ncbi:MAG: hypothetical protein IT574_09165 [Candidatus Aureabacteria bacterium]|nr:hypothetical protein [Candidatus Auribacterota bacterium]NLW93317.1 hypothetical protein [Chlamydiota bacterium]
MARNPQEWHSIKRARRCACCAREFADGDRYETFLFAVDGSYQREDYCAACRAALDSSAGPDRAAEALSSWKGRFKPEPPKEKEEPIARSTVERLLRKYLDSGEPAHVNFSYILALMLERKRKLLPRDRIVEPGSGRRLVVYEFAGSGETLLVEDPGLAVGQAREVQKQVRELLSLEGVH